MGKVVFCFADRLEEWYWSAAHHRDEDAWRPNTARVYLTKCRQLQAYFGNRAIKSITTLDVKNFLACSGLSYNSKLSIIRFLSQFMVHAKQKGWISYNPARGLRPKNRGRRYPRCVLDPEKLWALLQAAHSSGCRKLFPFCVAAFYSGLRSHCVLALQPADLLGDWIALDGSQTKTGKDLRVPVHPILKRIAHELPIARSHFTILCAIKEAGKRAGLDPVPRPHDLRRTFGTLLEQISSYATAQAALGHAPDYSQTAVYVRPTEAQVRRAVLGLPDFTGEAPPAWPPALGIYPEQQPE